MSAADPSAALCTYLAADGDVGDLVGSSIFRPSLPDKEDLPQPMPFACIVIKRAGGYRLFQGGNIPLGDPRLDIVCYGGTELEAEHVAAAVVSALRSLRQSVWPETNAEGSPTVRLLWANIEAGPLTAIDPDTSWPTSIVSAQVAHTEPALG